MDCIGWLAELPRLVCTELACVDGPASAGLLGVPAPAGSVGIRRPGGHMSPLARPWGRGGAASEVV
ncbi:hypothetical protein [Amycolatopsis sp. NPDC003676]